MQKRLSNIGLFVFLHILLFVLSLSGVFSKKAASVDFLSITFIVSYGIVILILGVYAIFWQQIIKRIPLTTAYANRAVTVIWGAVWGFLFFDEKITIGKTIGIVLVFAGIVCYSLTDNEKTE